MYNILFIGRGQRVCDALFGRFIFTHFKSKGGLSMAIGLEDPLNLYC